MLARARRYVPTTPEVTARAASYQRGGIKPLDSLHLASAVVSGAAFFCTTDDPLLRQGLKAETGVTSVVSPLELVQNLS